MIALRTFLLGVFLLHQGVVTFARIENSFGEMMVQGEQRNKLGDSVTKERTPKEVVKGHRASKDDAIDAYESGLLDGITLTLIFVALTMLIGCVAFLVAIYYSKGYAYVKRTENKFAQNLESVKVDLRLNNEKNRLN